MSSRRRVCWGTTPERPAVQEWRGTRVDLPPEDIAASLEGHGPVDGGGFVTEEVGMVTAGLAPTSVVGSLAWGNHGTQCGE